MSWISLLEEYFARLIINISLIHQDWLNHTLQVTNRHPKVALKIDLRVQYFMLFLKINKFNRVNDDKKQLFVIIN